MPAPARAPGIRHIDLGDGIVARINKKHVTLDRGGVSDDEYRKLFPPVARSRPWC